MVTEIFSIILFNWIGMTQGTPVSNALHFFLSDVTFLLSLLMVVTTVMAAVNAYFPVDKLKKVIENNKIFGLDSLLASMFGAITPFCSCSSIPLFVGFMKGGLPLNVSFSYLITSPLVNEIAFALLWSMFGIKVALIYAASGILLGTVLGLMLGRFNLEHLLQDWVREAMFSDEEIKVKAWNKKLNGIFLEGLKTVKELIWFVIFGIFVGSLIHGFVPANFFASFLGEDSIFAVPLSVLLAIPLYSNASGVLPVVQSLVAKGVPIGTGLAFMMAVVGLSLPEAMLLKKVMKVKLIGMFFGIVGISIILLGYLFNFII